MELDNAQETLNAENDERLYHPEAEDPLGQGFAPRPFIYPSLTTTLTALTLSLTHPRAFMQASDSKGIGVRACVGQPRGKTPFTETSRALYQSSATHTQG